MQNKMKLLEISATIHSFNKYSWSNSVFLPLSIHNARIVAVDPPVTTPIIVSYPCYQFERFPRNQPSMPIKPLRSEKNLFSGSLQTRCWYIKVKKRMKHKFMCRVHHNIMSLTWSPWRWCHYTSFPPPPDMQLHFHKRASTHVPDGA